MKKFLSSIFIPLTLLVITALNVSAQNAEFEVDAEIVAAIKGGDSEKLKSLLTTKGVDLNNDKDVAKLVQAVQNALGTPSVTELSAAVRSITVVVTSAIVESKVAAGESVSSSVLVEAVKAATKVVISSVSDSNASEEFATAVSNAASSGAAAAVTKVIVSAKADSGVNVTDADIVAAVKEATQVVIQSGGDANAAIAGAAEEALAEGLVNQRLTL